MEITILFPVVGESLGAEFLTESGLTRLEESHLGTVSADGPQMPPNNPNIDCFNVHLTHKQIGRGVSKTTYLGT